MSDATTAAARMLFTTLSQCGVWHGLSGSLFVLTSFDLAHSRKVSGFLLMSGMNVASDVTAHPTRESGISRERMTMEYFLTPELIVPAKIRKIAGR